MKTKKLELVWPGKNDGFALIHDEKTGNPKKILRYEVQPRLFVEEEIYGNCYEQNMLISGENLFALKTLKASGYKGRIKQVYIDPPYNTGNAFSHYDDGLEHSIWLTMMYDRLKLLKDLLSKDGSIWVQLDDNEAHYCRVLMDEIFGRHNFVANVIWEKIYAPKSSARHFSANHDHILVYAKRIEEWERNLLPRSEKQDKLYKNLDNDPRGLWRPNNLAARNPYSKGIYPITTPSGRVISGPPRGSFWRVSEEKLWQMHSEGRIWWGSHGNNVPAPKIYLSEVRQGIVPQTIWNYEDVGHTQDAKREIMALFPDEEIVFDTAKPERLMKRIIEIGSDEGDIVLDCFLGTGTTAAVAHKMGRLWIGIELGRHADTLCLPRLKKVVEGIDQGGISELVSPHPSRSEPVKGLFEEDLTPLGWTGGGGFRFYTIGKPLIKKDPELGIWRLNYTNRQLIEAVCLREGFEHCANGILHGIKGRHYAHITEEFVSQELVNWLATELKEEESLTIYCLKASNDLQLSKNVEIKRMPQAFLKETN